MDFEVFNWYCFEHIISMPFDVMALIFLALWLLPIPKEETCSLALGKHYLPSLLGIGCRWHSAWAGDLLLSGQEAAVKTPSWLLALMCRPFRPVQQIPEIELYVSFLPWVCFLKKRNPQGIFFLKLFNCYVIPLYLIFEKRHLRFSGNSLQRMVCFERGCWRESSTKQQFTNICKYCMQCWEFYICYFI